MKDRISTKMLCRKMYDCLKTCFLAGVIIHESAKAGECQRQQTEAVDASWEM